MTEQEAKKAFDELKAQGETEESILGVLYLMFQDDKFTLDEFESLVKVLGYNLTPEFKAMSPEDQKTKGWVDKETPAEGVSKEEVEEAKEVDGEEKKDETKKDEKGDESDEEAKAKKLFGLDK